MITETSVCDRNFVWRFCPLTSYKWSSLPPQYELGYFLMTRPKLAFNPQYLSFLPSLQRTSDASWLNSSSNNFLTQSSEQIFIHEIVPAFYPDPHLISRLLLWESGDKIFPWLCMVAFGIVIWYFSHAPMQFEYSLWLAHGESVTFWRVGASWLLIFRDVLLIVTGTDS